MADCGSFEQGHHDETLRGREFGIARREGQAVIREVVQHGDVERGYGDGLLRNHVPQLLTGARGEGDGVPGFQLVEVTERCTVGSSVPGNGDVACLSGHGCSDVVSRALGQVALGRPFDHILVDTNGRDLQVGNNGPLRGLGKTFCDGDQRRGRRSSWPGRGPLHLGVELLAQALLCVALFDRCPPELPRGEQEQDDPDVLDPSGDREHRAYTPLTAYRDRPRDGPLRLDRLSRAERFHGDRRWSEGVQGGRPVSRREGKVVPADRRSPGGPGGAREGVVATASPRGPDVESAASRTAPDLISEASSLAAITARPTA